MATTAPVRGTAATRQAGRRSLFWLGIGMSVVAFLLVLILGTVVAGYVSPGDVIDVEATVSASVFNANQQNPPQVTRTVFPGVHVIKVGPATNEGVKGGQVLGVTSSLTILVTPCDAPYLTWLVAN